MTINRHRGINLRHQTLGNLFNSKREIYMVLIVAVVFVAQGCIAQRTSDIEPLMESSVLFEQVETDLLWDSNQRISLVIVPQSSLSTVEWMIAFRQDSLMKTSDFGKLHSASVAINGGFFDMRNGGSVTYLEANDLVVASFLQDYHEGDKPSQTLNGALVISDDNKLLYEKDLGEEYFSQSEEEKAVLVTGPLLLEGGGSSSLPNTKFVNDRHPRSCICTTTKGDVLLLAVDGRRPDAEGMSLPELQEFLLSRDCRDAINLDGGGSTTLWSEDRGVLNRPSDIFGERPVANVLLFRIKE